MYLKDGTCQTAQVDHCTSFSLAGDCLSCSKSYFLDTVQQVCVAITTEQKIPNCDYYLSSSQCLKCADKYFLSGTVCEAIVDTVQNCLAYSGNGICMECVENNILSIDNKKCLSVTQI